MNEISSKMTEVAEPSRLKMNLQIFAEEAYPELEDSSDFEADAREFNSKMEKYVEERTPKQEAPESAEVEAVKPEVADPEPTKPKQDPETNKAFQEMRKQLEAEKARAAEIEAKAKKADELIAQQYGESHGIYTVEQYEQRLAAERLREENERYEQAGLTPEEIQKLREYDQLKNETVQQREERQAQENQARWSALYSTYPDLADSSKLFAEGKEPEWFNDEMKAELARGASPIAAYRHAHFDTILAQRLQGAQEAAKQDALDKINSKAHLAPNAVTGGEVDHVEIDEDTMRMYRSLNKGKTDAQIRAWHKKNAM